MVELGLSELEAQKLLSTLGNELITSELEAKLIQYGQEHTTSWLKKGLLSIEQAYELVNTLDKIDFQRVSTAFESTKAAEGVDENDQIEPPDIATYDNMEEMSQDKLSELEKLGTNEIAEGKAAVIILGGGQVFFFFFVKYKIIYT